MVVGDGERHQLIKRHLVFGVEVEQLRRDRGELEALAYHGCADEETRGDFLLAETRVAQRLEGAELVERMQRDALDVLGRLSSSAMPSSRTTQGTGWVLAMRFCFTSSSSARKRRPPAGTS